MDTNLKIIGHAKLDVYDVKDGELVLAGTTGFQKNIITNDGKAAAAGLVGNTGAITAFTHIAVGSGTTAESAAQTALVTEITNHGLARATATVSRTTTTATDDTLNFTKTFTITTPGGDTINEMGIFNASSSGTMLCRKKFTTGLPTVTDQVVVATYTIQFV